jgi:hypothetical protein
MLRRLLAAALLVCCLVPAVAVASYKDVIRDCVDDGKLSKRYTQQEYREALANMTTDAAQYYGCPDLIKRAQRQSASGNDDSAAAGTAGGGSGGGTPPTAAEQTLAQEDVAAAQRDGEHVAVADVRPGALAYRDFGSVSKLPTPLIILGVLLIAAAAAACAHLLRGLVRSRGTGA